MSVKTVSNIRRNGSNRCLLTKSKDLHAAYTSNDLDEMKGVQYSIFACLVISFVRFAYVL